MLRTGFQGTSQKVTVVAEKYQFGHYLIECNIKAITPDTVEDSEKWQRPQRRERPTKSCLMLVDYAALDRAYKDCIRNILRGASNSLHLILLHNKHVSLRSTFSPHSADAVGSIGNF